MKILLFYKVHTNPVLISFCSILYYRDLADHIKNYNKEKKCLAKTMINQAEKENYYFFIKQFGNKIMTSHNLIDKVANKTTNKSRKMKTKIYNKTIVNRWHLLIRLNLNKELIQFRKHNIRIKFSNESETIFEKIETVVCSKLKWSKKKREEDNSKSSPDLNRNEKFKTTTV